MVIDHEDVSGSPTQVIVTLRLRFKPGTVEDVLMQITPIVQLTRQEVGNIAFELYRARDDSDLLILFEKWRDQVALERHWEEDYTKRALALFEENLLTPLSLEDDVTYLNET